MVREGEAASIGRVRFGDELVTTAETGSFWTEVAAAFAAEVVGERGLVSDESEI